MAFSPAAPSPLCASTGILRSAGLLSPLSYLLVLADLGRSAKFGALREMSMMIAGVIFLSGG